MKIRLITIALSALTLSSCAVTPEDKALIKGVITSAVSTAVDSHLKVTPAK